MNSDEAILVVGASGMIGSALASCLSSHGHDVIRMTRCGGSDSLAMDLSGEGEKGPLSRPISVAYLCAACTSLDQCRAHPHESYNVNVRGTLAIAANVIRSGARVVFISSSLVFDGSTPFQRADAAVRPRTEYGRQKAEAESRLREMGERVCIVRFGKVLGPGNGLLIRWRDALQRGEAIHPFSDAVMAPISLDLATDVLARVGSSKACGIVQASAFDDVTYAAAARQVARLLGVKENLVDPMFSSESSIVLEHIPIHATLEATTLREKVGIDPPPAWIAIKSAIGL